MPFTKGTKRSAPRDPIGAMNDDEDDEVLTSKPAKKTKTSRSSTTGGEGEDGGGVDKDGNPFWDLSNKRRIGISEFNKATFINIREYYEKNGEMLPSKKGISLSIAQYEALVKAIPAINAKLRALGHNVEDTENGGGGGGGGGAHISEKPAAAKKVDDNNNNNNNKKEERSKSKKSNIEATSDEESD